MVYGEAPARTPLSLLSISIVLGVGVGHAILLFESSAFHIALRSPIGSGEFAYIGEIFEPVEQRDYPLDLFPG